MKYDVYLIGRGSGVYAQDYFREYIGSTWAISKEQACSNVRYRLKDDTKPHGGYSSEIVGDCLDEGAVFYSYEAKLSESRG